MNTFSRLPNNYLIAFVILFYYFSHFIFIKKIIIIDKRIMSVDLSVYYYISAYFLAEL